MEEIDRIVDGLCSKYGEVEIGVDLEEAETLRVEKELGVSFPADYKYFLNRYGYFSSDGPDVLGIGFDPEEAEYYSMPYYTKSDRECILPKHFRPRPKHTVVVGAYGGGGHYFLYCDNSRHPGKVVLLLDEISGKADTVKWQSFTEFLAHYL